MGFLFVNIKLVTALWGLDLQDCIGFIMLPLSFYDEEGTPAEFGE